MVLGDHERCMILFYWLFFFSRFDLPHDDDMRCRKPFYDRDPKAKTHVMSPTIDEYTDPWSWSECSSRLLTKFLE